jgi:hypothetical protein
MIELKEMIEEYKAERQYAINKANDAEEANNKIECEIWETIAWHIGVLVQKLETFKN